MIGDLVQEFVNPQSRP